VGNTARNFNDDPCIAERVIVGLPIYYPEDIESLIDVSGVQKILLAITSANLARRHEVLGFLEGYPIHVKSVAGLT
jgi:FlaA1/EpsC-like NDP-sugar epimerase